MSLEAQIAAFVGGQAGVLVGGWRFVLWVRSIVRDETGPIKDRLSEIERKLGELPCKRGDCP